MAPTITTGSISSNTITGFPNGSGIRLTGGNVTSLAAPISQIGTSGSHFVINSNLVRGFSAAVPMATEAIIVLASGRGTSFIDVTNNGTGANPVGFTIGDGISVNATWQHNLTSTITNNVVAPGTTGVVFNRGITGGAAATSIPGGTGDSAVLNATISSNTVSQTKGNGIYFIANQSSTLRAKVQSNTVAAPTDLGAGIRIDSGTAVAGGQHDRLRQHQRQHDSRPRPQPGHLAAQAGQHRQRQHVRHQRPRPLADDAPGADDGLRRRPQPGKRGRSAARLRTDRLHLLQPSLTTGRRTSARPLAQLAPSRNPGTTLTSLGAPRSTSWLNRSSQRSG